MLKIERDGALRQPLSTSVKILPNVNNALKYHLDVNNISI
jgi:hypothetical protein